MGDGTRLAVAIFILFIAMVAFFFAFHPSGVAMANGDPVKNPGDVLQWLFAQWDDTVSGKSATAPTPQGDGGGNTTPTTTGIAPGTSHIGVQGGNP
jgi:hypothetical protein